MATLTYRAAIRAALSEEIERDPNVVVGPVIDAEAYELLTTVPVRFHRVQRAFESLLVAPILELRGGELFRVRSSYFTMDPHQLPFARMEAYYRAYNRFTALVRDPRHHFHVRLGAGDFVLYDNFRMLHARTGFSGARRRRATINRASAGPCRHTATPPARHSR